MLPTNQWTFPLKFSSFTYYLVDLVGPCTDYSFSYINPREFGMIWSIALVQPVNLPSNPVVCRSRPLVYVGIRSVNGIIIDSLANVADQLMHYPVDIR